jgi:hypothetical protein
MKREARFASSHEEHRLADACPDGICRDQRPSNRFAIGADRLEHEQLQCVEVGVFRGGDDIADDPGKMHGIS